MPKSPTGRTSGRLSANSSNTTARAQALRQVAEDADLNAAEFNRAFVLVEFFGYLRRNPNDAPDADYTHYDTLLTKLNQFNGDYIAAETIRWAKVIKEAGVETQK